MPRAKKAIIAPSKEVNEYWIDCRRPKKSPYPDYTERSGKWLVFLPRNEADEMWFRIKDAVEECRERAFVFDGDKLTPSTGTRRTCTQY